MAKKQTDRLRIEKVRGQGLKEIFGVNAQIHDKLVSDKVTEFNKQGISEYLVDGFPVTEDLPF